MVICPLYLFSPYSTGLKKVKSFHNAGKSGRNEGPPLKTFIFLCFYVIFTSVYEDKLRVNNIPFTA